MSCYFRRQGAQGLTSICPEMTLSGSRKLSYRPDLPEYGALAYLVMLKK